jgi:hypothetical protein
MMGSRTRGRDFLLRFEFGFAGRGEGERFMGFFENWVCRGKVVPA